jgi:glycosyltransferase involved in cell wall biosynthesis
MTTNHFHKLIFDTLLTVTAIMVTQNRERQPFVAMSIRSFLHQTYPQATLLIVNDGNPVPIEHPRIKQLLIPYDPKQTLGDLRNIALDYCTSNLIIQWDDDDWSHPDRITRQVQAYQSGWVVLLKKQLRYDLTTRKCRFVSREQGIDGTILYPYSNRRYPSLRKREDTVFLEYWRTNKLTTVLDNEKGLYVRLYTGLNTWSQEHIMSHGISIDPPLAVHLMLKDLEPVP